MCEFHDSNCNGFGDMWWTDKCIYFSSSIDCYKERKAEKKAVGTTKALAQNELYEELETPEGERKIFRIAKAQDKATKEFSHIKQIKNEHGEV